ncbi:hypothetical protein NWF32_16370 [Pseudomonas qingdaonensis]|nr:hypothetical protein [Pseudomonas qingdaonensis]
MTPEQRHNVRALLSESFVDSWVDYAWIARELEPFDLAELKRIFYEEVAPVCYYNIVAPVPPVWTGFEPVSLNEEIEELLEARRRNPLRRHWDRLWAATWIRLWSQECWTRSTRPASPNGRPDTSARWLRSPSEWSPSRCAGRHKRPSCRSRYW